MGKGKGMEGSMRDKAGRTKRVNKGCERAQTNAEQEATTSKEAHIHPFIVNNAFKVFFVFFIFVFFVFFVLFVLFVDKEQCESNAQVDKRT